MTKYRSFVAVPIVGVALALVLLVTYAFTVSAYAEVRDSGERSRGTSGRVSELSSPSPSVIQAPTPQSPASTGGITSSTSGAVNTGDNTGGIVTTGDESVEVHEVNIGPTNPAPPSTEDESDNSANPESPCDRRSLPDCQAQSPERVR